MDQLESLLHFCLILVNHGHKLLLRLIYTLVDLGGHLPLDLLKCFLQLAYFLAQRVDLAVLVLQAHLGGVVVPILIQEHNKLIAESPKCFRLGMLSLGQNLGLNLLKYV